MSPQRATAAVYAGQLFQVALGDWIEALSQAAARLGRDKALSALLNDPGKDMETKLAQVTSLVIPTAAPPVRNLVSALIANGDINLLPEIAGELTRMGSRQSQGPTPAQITSAVPLTGDETVQLETRLRGQFGEDLAFTYEVDPAILGGLVIRVGDKLIDNSVRSRLNALREQLGVAAA